MKSIFYSLLALILVAGFGCSEDIVRPSGDTETVFFDFEDYSKLVASHAFDVDVTFSDDEELIEITIDENLLSHLDVKKVGNTLEVGLENNLSLRGNFTIKAKIVTKHVNDFSGSGASRIEVHSPIISDQVKIGLSGASSFKGEVVAQDLRSTLSGASQSTMIGSSGSHHLNASGASSFQDYDFTTDFLEANLSGASSCVITVNEEIDVVASGASSLRYHGTANITNIELSGGSTISRAVN